jgi:hypothetical protein
MDDKGAASAVQLRNRDAVKTLDITRPRQKAVTISAAAVFKKQKLDTPQLRPSPRSPQKPTSKKTSRKKQEEEVHPLALAFKGTALPHRLSERI